MTFSGATYESMLDIERLIFVENARLKAYQIKLEYMRKTKDKQGIEETQFLMGLCNNYVNELNKLEEDMLYKIDIFNRQLNDIEANIFIRKFIKSQENQQIEKELFLSPAAVSKYCKAIKEKMLSTEYGQSIINTLKKEEEAK